MSSVAATILTIAYLSGAVGVYRAYRRDFRDDPWWSCAVVAVLWPVVLAVQLIPKKLFILPLAAHLSGCLSTVARVHGCWGEPYIGTQCALGYAGTVPLLWADLPFDAVLDTVLLPADLICMPFMEHGYSK